MIETDATALSRLFHYHKKIMFLSNKLKSGTKLTGTVTHVHAVDTAKLNGVAVRISALNCPEKETQKENYANKLAKQFLGAKMACDLTSAKTYDRLVKYCSIDGIDLGIYKIQNSSCKVWKKYNV